MHDVTISQGDLKIRADRASVAGGLDYQNSKWTISGDVRINAQGGSLQSDQAVVTFSDNVITRATITGAPAKFEQQREGGAEPARGRANTIDYETATRQREPERRGVAVRWLQRDPRRAAGVQHPHAERAGTVGAARHRQRRRPHPHHHSAANTVRQAVRGAREKTMSVLRATHLAKSYRRRQVITDLSIEVESGQIVGLLGPNGAGKTTAFYMIVGLVPPDAGQVTIDERDITHLAMHQRAHAGIGYLPQEASVFRKLSVEDNVMAILETRDNLDETARQERLEQILGELRIAHVRKSLGMALSGGERRRVEIARALAAEPRFMLLDEPFAGVDPLSVIDIQRIMTGAHRQGHRGAHNRP